MAFNTQSGLSMGMTGAQAGLQMGGPWGALIGGGIGLLFGGMQPDNEKIMMQKYNDEVVKNSVRTMFDMRMEQNQENMRTSAALASYNAARNVQRSAATAQYGASDIIGASAQALKNTLDLQTNEAKNQTVLNAIVGFENFNNRIDSVTNQADSQLKRFRSGKTGIDPNQLVKTGVSMYGAFKGNTIPTMMDQFKSVWSDNPSTPKAIEKYDPRWIDTSNNTLNMFNSAVTG